MQYKDGEPCNHKGCLQHVSHPCEGCGRIAGQSSSPVDDNELFEKWYLHEYHNTILNCAIETDHKKEMRKCFEYASKIPGTVKSAIELFLELGNDTKNRTHNGYYSNGGWPYEILKKYIKKTII